MAWGFGRPGSWTRLSDVNDPGVNADPECRRTHNHQRRLDEDPSVIGHQNEISERDGASEGAPFRRDRRARLWFCVPLEVPVPRSHPDGCNGKGAVS